MSGNKLSFAILLYKIVSVGQTALSGLLAAVIVYGVALPPHLAWGLNLALAGIVLLIGLYFYLRLRAFRRVNPVVEGLRQFIVWDLLLQILIIFVLAATVVGASFRVFGEGFAVFG